MLASGSLILYLNESLFHELFEDLSYAQVQYFWNKTSLCFNSSFPELSEVSCIQSQRILLSGNRGTEVMIMF